MFSKMLEKSAPKIIAKTSAPFDGQRNHKKKSAEEQETIWLVKEREVPFKWWVFGKLTSDNKDLPL